MGQCHSHPADTFHSLQAASQFKQAYNSLFVQCLIATFNLYAVESVLESVLSTQSTVCTTN